MSDRDDSPLVSDSSEESGQCYCKGVRQLGSVELQCMSCLKWHHRDCLNLAEADTGPLIPFMNSYAFHCKVCSPTKCDGFLKKPATFVQMLQSTFANLIHQNKDTGLTVFSKDKDIIPFIEVNWEALTLASRKTKSTWHATVTKTLGQNPALFYLHSASDGSKNSFGMHDTDVRNICPNYESAKQQNSCPTTNSSNSTSKQAKNLKRKAGSSNSFSTVAGNDNKRVKTEVVLKLPAHGHPADHPFNKDEWCYIFAESDPYAEKEDDEEYDASKLIPPYSYRKGISKGVFLSMHDRAPQLKLADNRLTVSGEKGYCLIKGSHSAYKGCYYYEVEVVSMPNNSACRIGWCQEFANNQAPLGYDSFGYSYRSRKGTRFHKSVGKSYGQGFTSGDTVGVMIELPGNQLVLPECYKERPLIKFKNFLYYETKRNAKEQESKMKTLDGSKVTFFKNGQCQSTAFENIFRGHYFPAASLYKNCSITFNFGPTFKYPPSSENFNYLPFSERSISEMGEQQMSDLLFLIENDRVAFQYSDL